MVGQATNHVMHQPMTETRVELLEPFKSVFRAATTAVAYLEGALAGEKVADPVRADIAKYLIDIAIRIANTEATRKLPYPGSVPWITYGSG